MDDNQYKALCCSCDEVLLEDCTNPVRLAVAWLHVVREHPVFLQRYERLFALSSVPGRLSWLGIRRAVEELLRVARQLGRACKFALAGKTWLLDRLGTADTVFVSHLVNPTQRDAETDFYFGNLPAELAARGRRVAVVLIDHTSLSCSLLTWKVTGSGVLRLVLPNTLAPAAELRLMVKLWRQSTQLARLAAGSGLTARVRMAAAAEAVSSASFQALRIAVQVGELVKRLGATTLITTYEGHAWERATCVEARRQVPRLRCAGYQHAALFRFQHGLRRRLCATCDPDVIFASGEAAWRQLVGAGAAAFPNVRVLGSVRAGKPAKLAATADLPAHGRAPVCLVIPEGLLGESAILFKYALQCAERLPDVTFLWRMHPIISFDSLAARYPVLRTLPPNVEFSGASLEADAERSSWVLYRGSTAIVSAALAGAAPVYLRIEGEMTIDPLYELEFERMIVVTVDDFVALVLGETKEYPSMEKTEAVMRHCMEIFSPLVPEVLAGYLDDMESEPDAADRTA